MSPFLSVGLPACDENAHLDRALRAAAAAALPSCDIAVARRAISGFLDRMDWLAFGSRSKT